MKDIKADEPKKHRRDWFINRLYREKPIYRKSVSSIPPIEIRIKLLDEQHANYLYNCQNEDNIFYYDKSNEK